MQDDSNASYMRLSTSFLFLNIFHNNFTRAQCALPGYVFSTHFSLQMFDYMPHTQAFSFAWGFNNNFTRAHCALPGSVFSIHLSMQMFDYMSHTLTFSFSWGCSSCDFLSFIFFICVTFFVEMFYVTLLLINI